MKKLLIALMCFALTACYETEKGEKVGTIVKVASEGVLFKSNEAELIRGGMNGGSGGFGVTPFHFTIENDELLKKVQYAVTNQKEVRIVYHRELATLFRSESNDYFLDEIQILN